jgi:hypothetical protein
MTGDFPVELGEEANEDRRWANEVFGLGWEEKPDKVTDELLHLSRLWSPVEIHKLARDHKLLPEHGNKLKASIRKLDQPTECLLALERARPDLKRREPSGLENDELVQWWVDEVCK